MTKKTLKVTLKMDFVTDDEDFLEGFDKLTDDIASELLNEEFQKLDLSYDGTAMKLYNVKVKKLKR